MGRALETEDKEIQNQRYGYMFNAFSDGTFNYRNNNEGLTFKAMIAAGKTDPAIQARVDMFRHRVPQEFYDLQEDPGCTVNLFNRTEHQELIAQFQRRRRQWMVETGDHCLPAFDARDDPDKLAAEVALYPKRVKPGKKKLDEEKHKARRRNFTTSPTIWRRKPT